MKCKIFEIYYGKDTLPSTSLQTHLLNRSTLTSSFLPMFKVVLEVLSHGCL